MDICCWSASNRNTSICWKMNSFCRFGAGRGSRRSGVPGDHLSECHHVRTYLAMLSSTSLRVPQCSPVQLGCQNINDGLAVPPEPRVLFFACLNTEIIVEFAGSKESAWDSAEARKVSWNADSRRSILTCRAPPAEALFVSLLQTAVMEALVEGGQIRIHLSRKVQSLSEAPAEGF